MSLLATTAHVGKRTLRKSIHICYSRKNIYTFLVERINKLKKKAKKEEKREIDNTFSYQQFNKKEDKKKVNPQQKKTTQYDFGFFLMDRTTCFASNMPFCIGIHFSF